jgi:hypothetical protein
MLTATAALPSAAQPSSKQQPKLWKLQVQMLMHLESKKDFYANDLPSGRSFMLYKYSCYHVKKIRKAVIGFPDLFDRISL